MTYIVTFTHNGAPVCHWHGYATYADARRAIADADMAIPFAWDWRIDAAPDASAVARNFSGKFSSHDAAADWAALNGWILQESEAMGRGVFARFTG